MTYNRMVRVRTVMAGSAALVALAAGLQTQEAKAQSLQPVVDVCTGISLEPSAVTDIIDQANDPLITSLTSLTDNIVDINAYLGGIPLVGTILGTGDVLDINDVDIEIDDILAGIAAGDNIGLTVLDTNGNLIAPSDNCNITADGYTLDTAQGITIGGNQITGLGDDGETGIANDLDSIAIGNRALTEVGADASVAIGTDATVQVANSVALGTGSIADRAAMTGYSAPGLAGTHDSVGSVSVGSTGNLRQVTNVAPGTQDSDAATVGQVVGAVAELADEAVLYDDAAKTSVTLAGAGGTTVGNVADGEVSDVSMDAVNGSQLYATNLNVTQNATDITALDVRVSANEGDITAIDGRITTNETNIINLDGRVTQSESDIASLQALAVQYTDASQSDIVLGGAGGTTISNLADGEVSATSGEAINGAQLYAVQSQVDQNTTDIANIDTRVSNNETNITNLDGRVTTNESDIANLDDRVTINEGDIANLDGRVTVNEGDIANLDTRVTLNEGDIADLDIRVVTNETDISNIDARVTINEGDIVALDTRVTDNSVSITNIQAQVDNVPIAYVSDSDPTMVSVTPTQTTALMGADNSAPVTLTNIAAATLSASSTDAVNGAQLYATNQQVMQNTSDIVTNRTDIDQNTTDIANNRTDIDNNTNAITNIQNNFSGSVVVAVQYSDPDDPNVSNGGTVTNDVALVGADSSSPVALHNVATGVLPNDAVNVQQMQDGLAMAMDYTDMRFAQLNYDLKELNEHANAGTAAAMATAGLPQVIESDGRMMAGAIGHYRGETSFALGFSTSSNDGRAVAKVSGTVNTRGYAGISAGAGFAF